jgi:hypothetical protein
MDKILSVVTMGVHAAKLLSNLLYGESSSTMTQVSTLQAYGKWKRCTLNS